MLKKQAHMLPTYASLVERTSPDTGGDQPLLALTESPLKDWLQRASFCSLLCGSLRALRFPQLVEHLLVIRGLSLKLWNLMLGCASLSKCLPFS